MKRNYLLYAFIAFSMMVSSCEVSEIEVIYQEQYEVAVTATQKETDTKVSYGAESDSKYPFTWSSGDAFSFATYSAEGSTPSTNTNVSFSTTETTKSASFTGTVTEFTNEYAVGIYPYNSTGYAFGTNNGSTYVSLSLASQTIAATSNKYANIYMLAEAQQCSNTDLSSKTFSFNTLTAILRFNVTNVPAGETVTKITIGTSDNSLKLYSVRGYKLSNHTAIDDASCYTKVNSLSATVSGANANTDTEVNFALFPADLSSQSMIISVQTTNGSDENNYYEYVKTGISFAANTIYPVTFDITGSGIYKNRYIENGIDLGASTTFTLPLEGYLSNITWAPVNCGYEAFNYVYGKLYQWGRMIGQGYDYQDETFPDVTATTATSGNPLTNPADDTFYKSTSDLYDWHAVVSADQLSEWTAVNDKIADPCPSGWRVPASIEFHALFTYFYYTWTTSGIHGITRNLHGINIEGVSQVFFPAAGYCQYNGNATDRESRGYYWSSTPDGTEAYSMYFNETQIIKQDSQVRACGFSVRCVRI